MRLLSRDNSLISFRPDNQAQDQHAAPFRSAVRTVLSYLVIAVLCVPVFIILFWLVANGGVSAVSSAGNTVFSLIVPATACVFAICVVTFANPMHALLALVGVFLFTVLFYVSAGIEFIGLVFLIVYVGAVAILFLFVIMLLNVKSLTSNEPLLNHATQTVALVFGGLLGCHLFVVIADSVGRATLRARSHVDLQFTGIDDKIYYQVMYRLADVNAIASLYTEHVFLFWITTINLLLSLLGAIILATSTTEQTIVMVPENRQ